MEAILLKNGRLNSAESAKVKLPNGHIPSVLAFSPQQSISRMAVLLSLMTISSFSAFAAATDIYIAQNSAGAASGADCADAHPISWFNSSANWGSGSTQIGPGTTVHLCGTFTGSAGQNLLVTQGDGASGNPIIIRFESGAVLQAPYFGTNDGSNPTGGAININNNWITVDGGTPCGPGTSCASGGGAATGIIKNTLNGTSGGACSGGSCSNQQISAGVVITGVSNVEVRNLSVQNIYVHTACSSDTGVPSYGVFMLQPGGGTMSSVSVHDSYMIQMNAGFSGGYGSWSNFSVYNNFMTRMSIEIGWGDRGNGSTVSGFNVYGNELSNNYFWWDTGDANHLNGMHPFAVHTGSTMTGLNIYNNYIHGDFGNQHCGSTGHETAKIFVEGAGGGGITGNVFNNVLIADGIGDYPSTAFIGAYASASGATIGVYNNTIQGNVTGGVAISNGGFGTGLVKNNLISTVNIFEAQAIPGVTLTSNCNVFYNGASPFFLTGSSGSTDTTYAAWQAMGFDANSVTGNPLLNSASTPPYQLTNNTSSAWQTGTNLTGLGIVALDRDKAGVARPGGSAAWDIGAYMSSSSATTPPTPPSDLTATIN